VGTDPDRVVSSLLSRLEQKKQEPWEEAVNSMNFSYSRRKTCSTLNKLTGRPGLSSLLCPVSANSIASQLVKNGAHRWSRTSTRLNNKKLSDLWKGPTPERNSISVPFRQRILLAPEPRKVSGPGFYVPGVYSRHRVGSQILVLRFPHFLHTPNQNPQDLEKSTNSSDP